MNLKPEDAFLAACADVKLSKLRALLAESRANDWPEVRFEMHRHEILAAYYAFLDGERSERTQDYWQAMGNEVAA